MTVLPSHQEPVLRVDDCVGEHLEVTHLTAVEQHYVRLDIRMVHTTKSGKQ